MMKVKALLLALCLSLFSLVGLNTWFDSAFQVDDNSVRYGRQVEKNQSRDILVRNMDANTLAVFGSSELVQTFGEKFDPSVVFNYQDFHLMNIGRGNYRNLSLASILGTIGNDIPQKKSVLLESFQWFTPEGLPPEAILYRLSYEHVYYTLTNPKITEAHKRAFIDRMIEVSAKYPEIHDMLARYKQALLDEPDNILAVQMVQVHFQLQRFQNRLRYAMAEKDPLPLAGDKTPAYDWDQRYQTIADQEGAASKTDNNPFQIDNHYYDTEVKADIESYKDSDIGKYTPDSPEFTDLGIFLDIAQDLGIELRVGLLPVNGKWYDYTGMTADKRKAVYDKLKAFLDQRGVKYWDYSGYDYEPYVMHDMLHLGWKGWTLLEKDLYEYGKQN